MVVAVRVTRVGGGTVVTSTVVDVETGTGGVLELSPREALTVVFTEIVDVTLLVLAWELLK